ncbi:diacylglycerol kinase family protein [Actinomyces sp. 594]|uniref:diacylglycerol/lipid kinase family protein n=1 Tax=Actinomyces sp. 594 TaxID=2057793 RepID=UPI00214CE561|nr:diacylglycerol kinase family protein [Actinomyces sp. 594]
MTAGTDPAPVAAVVINPAKPAATRAIRQALGDALYEAGYRTVWLETSARETGATQARLAVASGAGLVVAAGGDGTVRSVAAGLAGTGVELGVMPLGTANLAARNLGLPLRHWEALTHIAAVGRATPTDLLWVRTEPTGHTGPLTAADDSGPVGAAPPRGAASADGARGGHGYGGHGDEIPEPPQGWARPTLGGEHACLVVAGIGFDAGLVASTRPALKARLSWGAYGLAALENLGRRRMGLVLGVTGGTMAAVAEVAGRPVAGAGPDASAEAPAAGAGRAAREDATAGTAVAGTADAGDARGSVGADDSGRLVCLVPEATPAFPGVVRTERLTARTLLIANGGKLPAGITLLPDARLDDGLLDVAAIDTVRGLWGWASLARQVLPPRPASYSAGRAAQVLLRRGREVRVLLDLPTAVEIDGDLVAPTRGVRVRVQPGALRVRRPA